MGEGSLGKDVFQQLSRRTDIEYVHDAGKLSRARRFKARVPSYFS